MSSLEIQLEALYPQYRRIWVQYSNNRGYSLVITLFPQGWGPYRMLFGQTSEITLEILQGIITKDLEVRN